MAERPVFLASTRSHLRKGEPPGILVTPVSVSFKWFPGLSASQRRKCVESLHQAASAQGIRKILEISTKSEDDLGWRLSAFNLQVDLDEDEHAQRRIPLECAFQGSKVFTQGGPFTDLYEATSREAKQDPRLRTSGDIQAFKFGRLDFPSEPKTAFYDWLYARTLAHQGDVLKALDAYEAFSDIEFNPKKSINCQARSCAVVVSLFRLNRLVAAVKSPDSWLRTLGDFPEWTTDHSSPSGVEEGEPGQLELDLKST